MRSERDVFQQILDFVLSDENIRAAVLNGSRANPNAPKDFMQDYDVCLYCRDLNRAVSCYREDRSWIGSFGKLIILQQNNFEDGSFIFLLQFDSVRIDLGFQAADRVKDELEKDSLSKILYDKDNILLNIPESNESSYYVKKPDRDKWDSVLNELWWLQGYVAKELWRDEIPLAKELYDNGIMGCLRELVSWYIADKHNWRINVGHGGKWFKTLLDRDLYNEYIALYSGADAGEQWDKLLRAGSFIRKIGLCLSSELGFEYPLSEDIQVSSYIRKIHALPADAASF